MPELLLGEEPWLVDEPLALEELSPNRVTATQFVIPHRRLVTLLI